MVLLDLVLPDIDGIALLRQLKAIDDVAGDDRDQRRRHDHPRARSRPGRRVLLPRKIAISIRPASSAILDRATGLQVERAQHERLEGAGARSVRLLEHHRQEQEDARALRADRGGGRERRQHPDPGRERRRQGADRQRDPRAQRPRQGAVHQDQLRGAAEGPDRVGAVRLQEGRVHRRDHRQGRPARTGRRRLADARRDRRDAAAAADQAAARAAGARVPADRQRPPGEGGLPADLRHQHRARGGAARTAGCARTCTSASTP